MENVKIWDPSWQMRDKQAIRGSVMFVNFSNPIKQRQSEEVRRTVKKWSRRNRPRDATQPPEPVQKACSTQPLRRRSATPVHSEERHHHGPQCSCSVCNLCLDWFHGSWDVIQRRMDPLDIQLSGTSEQTGRLLNYWLRTPHFTSARFGFLTQSPRIRQQFLLPMLARSRVTRNSLSIHFLSSLVRIADAFSELHQKHTRYTT